MRTAILADLHGNLEALDACLIHARHAGAGRFICLGDFVGYGADPEPVVRRMRELPGLIAVRGNHDEALFTGRSALSPAGVNEAIEWTRTQLRPADLFFLRNLPLERREKEVLYVHASAAEPARWTYIQSREAARECLAATDARAVFVGHVHEARVYYTTPGGTVRELIPHASVSLPLSRRSRYVITAGSVGQPRDGHTTAAYILYDEAAGTIHFQRVPYDYRATAGKIIAAGLEPSFARRLAKGR